MHMLRDQHRLCHSAMNYGLGFLNVFVPEHGVNMNSSVRQQPLEESSHVGKINRLLLYREEKQ